MNIEEKSKASNAVFLDQEIMSSLRELIAGRTDSSLQQQFGISYNTWRKLDANMPIRASVADRLVRRIQAIENTETV